MTPAEARAMYRRQLEQHGETIAIRRYSGTGTGRTHSDKEALARVVGYGPSELVGGITQGDRRVIVLAEDLEGYSPPFVMTKSDKIYSARFGELQIIGLDDSTRRIDDVLVAYELQCRG